MGLVIRQSIYTTAISYAGAVIGYINLLYLFPKFLEPAQVGLLRTIQDAAILLTPFATFGLAQSIFRFYPQLVKDKTTEAGFVSLITLLALTGFAIFFVFFKAFETSILSYFEDNAKEIMQYAAIVVWLTLILLITSLLEAYSRSLLKMIFPSLLREVVVRLLLALLVIAYFQGYITYNQFIVGTVIAYLFCLLLLVIYLSFLKKISFTLNLSSLQPAKIKSLVVYSSLSFAGTAGMILIGKVDSMMVSGMLGLAANAVYTTAFYMATIIEIPRRAMSQVAMPLIARAFEKNDLTDIQVIYRKTAINQFIIGALLLIGVYINLDNIFSLMPRQEVYEVGKWVVIIVGIGKLTDMLFGPSSEIIVLSKYYAFNILLLTSLAAVVIVSNNILIPIYGINGAAIGSALALISFNILKYFFIWYKLKMQPFNWDSLKVLIIALVMIGLNLLIPKFQTIVIDIAIRSTAIGISYSILIFYSRATPDGNAFLLKQLNRLGLLKKN
ncbi:MAG: oligosaccharide flippase family protein [Cyclobacteriaceae bacterium]|nr:oligosaccharide flippase family protein [Cyclobacteriaceae bacterium]